MVPTISPTFLMAAAQLVKLGFLALLISTAALARAAADMNPPLPSEDLDGRTVDQIGNKLTGSTLQSGDGHRAANSMNGVLGNSFITQSGHGNIASVSQVNGGAFLNVSNVTQGGQQNVASVSQNGNAFTSTVSQPGSYNVATVSQHF